MHATSEGLFQAYFIFMFAILGVWIVFLLWVALRLYRWARRQSRDEDAKDAS
jgi:hypothetical protein